MRVAGLTDIGKQRKNNEDAIYFSDKKIGCFSNVCIVADGMGGHNAGEFASELAINSFLEYIQEIDDINDIEETIKEIIARVNKTIYMKAKNKSQYTGMGTTFLMATMDGNELIVANVGDSRLYTCKNKLVKITTDHSLVEEMIIQGKITKEEAINHPQKNIITRAVGVEDIIEVDTFKVELDNCTYVLLCSDGLTNMLNDDKIISILNQEMKLEEKVKRLVEEANLNGGYDNISVILIDCLA